MCDPITMMAASAGMKSLQIWGQRQATKAGFGVLSQQRKAQAEEISGKAGRTMGERVKQGRAESARLRVAAGEAGVTGNSVAVAAMDVGFQQDEDIAAIAKDAEYAQRASESRFQTGLARLPNPGALSNALQIGFAGYSGYATGLQIQGAQAANAASGYVLPPLKAPPPVAS